MSIVAQTTAKILSLTQSIEAYCTRMKAIAKAKKARIDAIYQVRSLMMLFVPCVLIGVILEYSSRLAPGNNQGALVTILTIILAVVRVNLIACGLLSSICAPDVHRRFHELRSAFVGIEDCIATLNRSLIDLDLLVRHVRAFDISRETASTSSVLDQEQPKPRIYTRAIIPQRRLEKAMKKTIAPLLRSIGSSMKQTTGTDILKSTHSSVSKSSKVEPRIVPPPLPTPTQSSSTGVDTPIGRMTRHATRAKANFSFDSYLFLDSDVQAVANVIDVDNVDTESGMTQVDELDRDANSGQVASLVRHFVPRSQTEKGEQKKDM